MKVEIGNATLYLGDCMDILPTLDKVDAVITDPPYGIGFKYIGYDDTPENLASIINCVVPICREKAERVIITPGLTNLQNYPKADWIASWTWGTTATFGKLGYNQWQPILFYGVDLKGFGNINGILKSDRIQVGGWESKDNFASGEGHCCPKPLAFVNTIIARFTRERETVLDPFMGSGTTGVAAVQMGRKFIGIEREPKYFEIACKRIEQAVAQGQLFEPEQPKQIQEAMF
jgi:site-specific DNA-methyltransferase (adenine-specific)/modification methylase